MAEQGNQDENVKLAEIERMIAEITKTKSPVEASKLGHQLSEHILDLQQIRETETT
jgi:hypothetical protein